MPFKVAVIGDGCIDEYRLGVISRLNPEASAPLLSVLHTIQAEGMAGNVANNLKAFGVDVELKEPVLRSKKIRFIDRKTGKHLLRVDHDIYADAYNVEARYDFDAIVVSDYAKGFVSEDLVERLQERFKGPIFVDTKRTRLQSYDNVYYKINQLEFSKLQQTPSNLIVTLGERGCIYDGKVYASEAINVVDVCGAGDVFLAGLVYGYLLSNDISKAIQVANKAASISCKYLGTYSLSTQEALAVQQGVTCTS